ncbi:histidyl-tRNA synthetase [Abditibacterium utsteinense]|uniref:Histidine--tRNA ligase n=1 Tax=Abditibacterium utsteinense TaxID=1960156 RepID=A0A2S8SXC7_9BACT|nr:histidine--tRNA ligase [Abditibacterium utsteinense]PQV65457.1 histidyl-tRNA synthetase [Abditibacterium utsteinense]
MSQNTKFQSPRGTHDILPDEIEQWRFVEKTFRALCAKYSFEEIRTPLFEATELFARATGESSDVMVTKQMYSFVAPDEQSYTLRPEGTAGVVRAYLEHNLNERGPVAKLFYIASIFRYEAPGAGRYRQHHQCGIEMLGAAGPDADVEVLALSHDFLRELGIAATLKINSLGTKESRRDYVAQLRAHLLPQFESLSPDSKRRFETNPLRIFDSKEARDHAALQGAPRLLDHLREHDAESLEHFEVVCKTLDSLGIVYEIDHDLVRGFDYYSRTAFEWVSDKLGAQSTILGGGRYDGLVEELGGAATPGIGFGSGIERLLLVREASGAEKIEKTPLTAFLVTLGDEARAAGAQILATLRENGIHSDRDFAGRSMRAQMREANRQKARYVLIVGEDELKAGTVSLKNMESGTQETVPMSQVIESLSAA